MQKADARNCIIIFNCRHNCRQGVYDSYVVDMFKETETVVKISICGTAPGKTIIKSLYIYMGVKTDDTKI